MSIGTVETQFFTFGSPADPFLLQCGSTLDEVTLAYETYGELNPDRSNAIVVFHALTGNQHVAGHNPAIPAVGDRWTEELHRGWWDGFVGPGKAIDTDRFFLICANYLGGCYGSTGPASLDPSTGKPYGSAFPYLCFADMVDAHLPLLEHFGIEKLHAAVGGSTGGVMVLSLATRYPDLVDVVIPIASGTRATPLQLIHNFEQINAIQHDPNFSGGDYYESAAPDRGLGLARMISHKTFVSLRALEERARSEVLDHSEGPGTYRLNHVLESYMWHQGQKFVKRFDANSYLRIMHAWQTFDLAAEAGLDDLSELFTRCKHQRYMVFSIDSDVCFYPEEQQEMVRYLDLADVPYRWITVHSDKGHDSFLVEPELFTPHLVDTLNLGGNR
ncbi:MAG TPA: homoserine O-acetyltransferase [Acidimicrobiia bacterium]|nr:homoserine O-acetyltransferase [Acidimicrobiia bacterium]